MIKENAFQSSLKGVIGPRIGFAVWSECSDVIKLQKMKLRLKNDLLTS